MFSFEKTMFNILLRYSREGSNLYQNSPVFINNQFGCYGFEMEARAKRHNLKLIYMRDHYVFPLQSNLKSVENFVDELNSILVFRKLVKSNV